MVNKPEKKALFLGGGGRLPSHDFLVFKFHYLRSWRKMRMETNYKEDLEKKNVQLKHHHKQEIYILLMVQKSCDHHLR